MATFDERQREYDENILPASWRTHIATGIRKKFADRYDFSKLSDQEVIQRHYGRFGKGMKPEEYQTKLDATYGADFSKPEAPQKTLGDRAADVGEAGKHIAEGLAPFIVPEVGKAAVLKAGAKAVATKIPVASQIGFLGGHAINAAVDTGAAKQLAQTISDIPVPDEEAQTQDFYARLLPGLSAKGFSPDQIMQEARSRAQNISRGYQKTVTSIEQDVEGAQNAAMTEPARAATDAFFLGVGAPMIEGALQAGMAKLGLVKAAAVGAKPVSNLLGNVASHIKTGVIIGAPGMGLQGAITAGVEAAAANKTPHEIGQALVQGATTGAREGAIGGALIGGLAGGIEASLGVVTKPLVERQRKIAWKEERAQIELDDARLRGWQEHNAAQKLTLAKNIAEKRKSILSTADSFDPHTSAVPLEGDPAETATTLIQQTHGDDAAMSEVGLRAASKIADRIRIYQESEKALNPTVDLAPAQGAAAASPVGASLEQPQPGIAPEPNAPAAVQGPIGERNPQFTPPVEAPSAGVEGAPTPTKAAPEPLRLEGIAPEEPVRYPALQQPLGPIEQGGRPGQVASEIAPRALTKGPEAPPISSTSPTPPREVPLETPTQTVRPELPQITEGPGWLQKQPDDNVITVAAKRAVQHFFNKGEDQKAVDLAIKMKLLSPKSSPKSGSIVEKALSELNVGEHASVEAGENEINITRLGLPEGKTAEKGALSNVLDEIVRKADEHHLPVTTRLTQVPGPRGGKIPIEKLLPWYEQRGFKLIDSKKLPEGQMATATLRREPSALPSEKMEMLPTQRAMVDIALSNPETPSTRELAAPERVPGPGRWHQTNLWADSNIAAAKERINSRESEFPEAERKKKREAGFVGERDITRDPTSYDWADFADRVQIGVNIMLKHGLNKAEWIEHMVAELGGKFRVIADRVYQESVAAFNARRPKGIDEVRQVVDDYVHQSGLGRGATRHDVYPEIDPKFSHRVAVAYHTMKNVKPGTPEYLAAEQSYEALNHEIDLQYEAMIKAGYKVTFTRDDPYPTSADMRADVSKNKHIKAYKTGEDFHPFMTPEQNDKLRAVHDFFGHAAEGYEFGPRGEDAAFRKHASTLSTKSIAALATETRGQNSWVNFWPKNAKLEPKDRPFAEQKFGLLPSWAYEDVIKARVNRAPANRLTVGLVERGPKVEGRQITDASTKLSRGIRPVKKTDAVRARFVADGTSSINEMMAVSPESATWYHDDIEKMHKMTEKEIPSLSRPGHQALFDLLLGFTSPNTNVPQNYARAISLMRDFERSGKIPLLQRFGQEVNITSRSWVPRLNKLIEKFDGDLEAMRDYMLTKDEKTQVYNVEKEFGDKVGPFTLNIQGIHDQITVDVWMVRRLRRLSGTLYKDVDGKKILNEDWAPTAQERRDLEESIRELSKSTGLDPDAIQAVLWDNEKMVWERAGLTSPRIPFSAAAEGVLRSMHKQAEGIHGAHQQERLPF